MISTASEGVFSPMRLIPLSQVRLYVVDVLGRWVDPDGRGWWGSRQGCSTLSTESHMQQFSLLDATGGADDSAGRKSLNLCEATESMGCRLEVLGAVSGAARHNP